LVQFDDPAIDFQQLIFFSPLFIILSVQLHDATLAFESSMCHTIHVLFFGMKAFKDSGIVVLDLSVLYIEVKHEGMYSNRGACSSFIK
jgi:hypothetical protein